MDVFWSVPSARVLGQFLRFVSPLPHASHQESRPAKEWRKYSVNCRPRKQISSAELVYFILLGYQLELFIVRLPEPCSQVLWSELFVIFSTNFNGNSLYSFMFVFSPLTVISWQFRLKNTNQIVEIWYVMDYNMQMRLYSSQSTILTWRLNYEKSLN